MNTNIEFWALTFDFVGKLLIAITALLVHRKLIMEKRIDRIVLKNMKLEFSSGVLGIILLTVGYILHLEILYAL